MEIVQTVVVSQILVPDRSMEIILFVVLSQILVPDRSREIVLFVVLSQIAPYHVDPYPSVW